MLKKFFLRLSLIKFFLKAAFSTKLEGIDTQVNKESKSAMDNDSIARNQLIAFLRLYDVNKEDKVDYTNTHEDHHSNFKRLDEYQEDVLSIAGLIYDGNVPRNAAEVFDMTYEEYSEYKKKILPIGKERKIEFSDIEDFLKRKKISEVHKIVDDNHL